MSKWIVWALAALLLAGCASNANRNDTSPSPQNNQGITAKQQRVEKKEIRNPDKVEARLEKLAAGVPGVRSARCVVLGNTAIVGIDVEENLERSRVGTIKYSVAEAFRKDPYGADAFVTADMDLAARIAEIRSDIDNGRPIAGFAEELADIIGRIVPQMPRDTEPEQDSEVQNQGAKLRPSTHNKSN